MSDSRTSHFAAALKAAVEADATPRGTRWKHDAWGLCECGRKKRHHLPDGSCPPEGGHASGLLAAAAPEIVAALEAADRLRMVAEGWGAIEPSIALGEALRALDRKVPQ